MRPAIVVLLLSVLLATTAGGQTRAVQIRSPFPNPEICLALRDSIPISATVTNRDTVRRTLVARFEIQNVVTKIAVYARWDTLWNIGPGISIDTSFLPYGTDPNKLSQLGSFIASATITALDPSGHEIGSWPFRDSTYERVFGIRRTAQPFRDASN